MLGYVLIGTNDVERAGKFYDELLGVLGAKRFMEMERLVAWSAGHDSPGIGVCKPYDGDAATVGNGMMVALAAGSPEKVQAVYDKAIELGGADEGGPGRRMGNFYGAYFRDLDGNKLNAFCIVPDEG
ncbi:VOC family protein [Candidatus Rariloculus sp.]|uniref:VOC family protein n=1 Tax=Candidatus Rariloculus sp. TaxID=3101265 RepID=UPI003D0993BD